MGEKLSMKQLEKQWVLNDEEYKYFLAHGITVEEYLIQKNEEHARTRRNEDATHS